jgi:hypothetical protein
MIIGNHRAKNYVNTSSFPVLITLPTMNIDMRLIKLEYYIKTP